MNNSITAVHGIEVGHYTDLGAATGCTVILCRDGAVGGVDVRGGAPGTRETDVLRPGNLVQNIHGVLLTGGSAFGLAAASGVMDYLEERGVGFQIGSATVPIVPAAVIFDLGLVSGTVRPTHAEGYKACLKASACLVEEGSVGAGTGATLGKALGMDQAIKAGIGTASLKLGDGIIVGALVVVNAYGSLVDHIQGKLVAGPRNDSRNGFCDTVEFLLNGDQRMSSSLSGANTTIGVIATDARLTKEQANFLAKLSHDGLALTIRPCHTTRDGDTLFSMATGTSETKADITRIGAAAVEVVAMAVLRSVEQARGLGGIPSISEYINA